MNTVKEIAKISGTQCAPELQSVIIKKLEEIQAEFTNHMNNNTQVKINTQIWARNINEKILLNIEIGGNR